MADVQAIEVIVVQNDPQVCKTCGKGIAVTTEGECGVCDGILPLT